MGIKHKIRLGFITIGILLFLSGIISSLEMIRFSRETHKLLERSNVSITVSKQMLDAVQEQNIALLLLIAHTNENGEYDSRIVAGRQDFDKAFHTAKIALRNSTQLEDVQTAAEYYNSIVSQVNDTMDITWFTDIYKISYYNLTHAIRESMVQIQQQALDYTTELEENAYRSSMVGIIALGAGIMLLLVFYFMLKNYFIKPIIQITKSLKGYVNSRIPFEVNISTQDEIRSLKEYIATIVTANKKSKQ